MVNLFKKNMVKLLNHDEKKSVMVKNFGVFKDNVPCKRQF